MAFASTLILECRSAGHIDNGGGFDPISGTPGTDYSQQDSPQVTYTDLVIGTVTTELTSAGTPFTSAHVGNVIKVTSGAGFNLGRFQVMSVAASVATMDRSVGTASSTGGNGRLGGAIGTLQEAISAMTHVDHLTWIKGSFTITASVTFPAIGGTTSRTRVVGYGTTRGDNTQVVVSLSGSTISGFNLGQVGWSLENLHVNCLDQTSSEGFNVDGANNCFINCRAQDATLDGFDINANQNTFIDCLADGCNGDGFDTIGSSTSFENCWARANTGHGFNVGNSNVLMIRCRATGNNGATSDGVLSNNVAIQRFFHCVFHNNTRDGIRVVIDGPSSPIIIENCVFTQNDGWGINFSSASEPNNVRTVRNNAFGSGATWDNDLGTINNWTTSTDGNVTIGSNVDPYTDSGNNDFTLNNNNPGGAQLRNTGTNNTDIGYWQHSDPASSGITIISRPRRVM